jgi:CDP-diacylglycerol--glycerol-3-phosphate 3-phosphatidyltransferase
MADRLSALRIILAPVFFIVYFLPVWIPAVFRQFPRLAIWSLPVLWIIFVVSELTDMLDGMVARKRGEVSDFGKLFDPFADTLVQLTYFLCFVLDGIFPVILFIPVLYREFSILFVRNLMLRKGVAMGARISGKIKTVSYISSCALALLAVSIGRFAPGNGFIPAVRSAAVVVFVLSVVLSVISFLDYVKVYRTNGG